MGSRSSIRFYLYEPILKAVRVAMAKEDTPAPNTLTGTINYLLYRDLTRHGHMTGEFPNPYTYGRPETPKTPRRRRKKK